MTEHEQAPASPGRRGSTTVQSADDPTCPSPASEVAEQQCSTDPRSESDSRSRLKVPARSSTATPSAEAAHRKEGSECNQPSGCAKAGGGTAFGEGPALADPLIREASSSRASAGRGVVTLTEAEVVATVEAARLLAERIRALEQKLEQLGQLADRWRLMSRDEDDAAVAWVRRSCASDLRAALKGDT
jgi:hypothetical protein